MSLRVLSAGLQSARSFLKHYYRLRDCELVLDASYAEHYLGSARFRKLAVIHYLLIGERLGYRPNPFFDPSFFAKATGGSHRSLADYLEYYASGSISPSREFEHDWYKWQNGDWSQKYDHPFLHYYSEGLDQDRDPAAGVDIQKLRLDLDNSKIDLVRYLYHQVLTQGRFEASFSFYSQAELLRAQQVVKAAIKLQIHREQPSGRRRFLVFVQTSHPLEKAYDPARTFDVLLNFYDGPPTREWPGIEYLVSQRGTKTTGIAKLMAVRPDILLSYDAVLFLDDDVELSSRSVDELFAKMEQAGLDLAQPSLSAESVCSWPVLKQPSVGTNVRGLNTVEIMMPALSRLALRTASWTFDRSVSGYGVDLLLGREIVDRRGRKAGVIGSVVATHRKPIDSRGGSFYKFLRSSGINPKFELWTIMKEFEIECAIKYRD